MVYREAIFRFDRASERRIITLYTAIKIVGNTTSDEAIPAKGVWVQSPIEPSSPPHMAESAGI